MAEGAVVGVVAALLGLPTLLLAVLGLQRGAAGPSDAGPGRPAGRGGTPPMGGGQAEVRRLGDPYPLPVAWTAADPSVSGSIAAVAIGLGAGLERELPAGLAFGAFVATGGSLWWRFVTVRFLLAGGAAFRGA
ncbi:hypothetical protein ACWDZW_22945 [Streptomyces coeruleorubidus]|uniref:hypothetical protein n=1 Tax=Streptomyces coeruleorubidus TaxID=116188 RepID=UPI0033FF79E3